MPILVVVLVLGFLWLFPATMSITLPVVGIASLVFLASAYRRKPPGA